MTINIVISGVGRCFGMQSAEIFLDLFFNCEEAALI